MSDILVCHGQDGLHVNVKVLKALIAFASQDITRASLYGVGIDNGMLCATDGHTAARVLGPDPGAGDNGLMWHRDYAEQQAKIAAATKAPHATLAWSEVAGSTMAPVSNALPYNREVTSAVGLNALYLSRLVDLAKAVAAKPKKGHDPAAPIELVHAKDREPLIFEICAWVDGPALIEALIMPMVMKS